MQHWGGEGTNRKNGRHLRQYLRVYGEQSSEVKLHKFHF